MYSLDIFSQYVKQVISKGEEIIYVYTSIVNGFKAKLKKNGSVVPLLSNNE